MAIKNLTLTEDACNLSAGCKSRKLIDFFGVLSENEGEKILKIIEKKRWESRRVKAKI